METVFGPLSGEYCYYFYFLSIFMFFLTVAGGSLTYLLLYFVNRLMYSVCTKAL